MFLKYSYTKHLLCIFYLKANAVLLDSYGEDDLIYPFFAQLPKLFLLSTPLPKVLGVQDHLFLLGRGLAHLRRPISSALVPERDLIGGLAQLIRGAYWLLALQPMVDLVEGAAGGSPTLLRLIGAIRVGEVNMAPSFFHNATDCVTTTPDNVRMIRIAHLHLQRHSIALL